jgi:DNA primase
MSFEQANSIETARVMRALGYDAGRKNVIICPWHNEKTPSLHIFEGNKGTWCFGCNRGGSNIDTVMINFNCTEAEALRWFEDNFPHEVDKEDRYSFSVDLKAVKPKPAIKLEKTYKVSAGRIAEINKIVCKLFMKNTNQAKNYLQIRGLEPSTVRKYCLGYAPKGYSDILYNNGIDREELFESGMILQTREGRIYEPFADRLVFPIIESGIVYGFSARAIHDWQKVKYINSCDNALYHKKERLYGMHIAENSAEDSIFLVEGNIDVLTLNQHGMDNVVANCGTAFTVEQSRSLVGLGKKIFLMYDGDKAGRSAMEKAYEILGGENCTVGLKKLALPPDTDPDTFVRENGIERIKNASRSA